MALPNRFSSLRPSAAALTRTLATSAPRAEKHFVRIAGPAAHASTQDINVFLQSHNFPQSPNPYPLVQGQSDIFQNHSVWLYDAGSQDAAENIAQTITGRIMGLKLIRAMPVDQKLVDGLIGVPKGGDARRTTLRKRLNIIAPKPEERGRSLLATNLPRGLQPRYLWSFFATYDVEDVRLLRKSCVACISFTTQREAERALRERANFSLHGQDIICLKMHE